MKRIAVTLACLLLLASSSFAPRRAALVAGAVLGVVALLASPASRSQALVRHGDTDSGRPGSMPAAEVSAISSYLARHAAGDRFELATASYSRAGPIIVHDARPVIVETSIFGRPVTTTAKLRAQVDSGQVHYALVGGVCGNPNRALIVNCPAIVRWTRAHSVDVSRAAGLHHRGVLFAFKHPA